MLTADDDPAPCRTATLCVLRSVLAHVDCGGARLHRPKSLSELADFLGLGLGVAADVACAIEDDWLAPLSGLSRKLGCQKRTLERQLSRAGLTAQAMRQAIRMIRATTGFFSGDSATAIAFDSGFADAAHMSRAFRAACGMAPTMLMKIARGDGASGKVL
jgi:AraC-like DNA-binding protein